MTDAPTALDFLAQHEARMKSRLSIDQLTDLVEYALSGEAADASRPPEPPPPGPPVGETDGMDEQMPDQLAAFVPYDPDVEARKRWTAKRWTDLNAKRLDEMKPERNRTFEFSPAERAELEVLDRYMGWFS